MSDTEKTIKGGLTVRIAKTHAPEALKILDSLETQMSTAQPRGVSKIVVDGWLAEVRLAITKLRAPLG